jgi:hypothetical protein
MFSFVPNHKDEATIRAKAGACLFRCPRRPKFPDPPLVLDERSSKAMNPQQTLPDRPLEPRHD